MSIVFLFLLVFFAYSDVINLGKMDKNKMHNHTKNNENDYYVELLLALSTF